MGYTLDEFQKEAVRFAGSLMPGERATVVALSGDLGAGKTTFTQALAHALGVEGDITSPTFVIQKRYPLEGQVFSQLVHVDAYRLERADELRALDWDELLCDPATLIVVEWPEHVAGAIPHDAHTIYFTYIDEHTRDINYHGKEENKEKHGSQYLRT